MDYVRLGCSGLKVSRIGLGMMSYGDPAAGSDRLVDLDVLDAVRAIAKRRGVPPACVAPAWLHSQPGVTAPIIGATSESHIRDATAAPMIELEDTEAADLERAPAQRLLRPDTAQR